MRFVRLLAAVAALACSTLAGQAQAAKVFTISGTAVPNAWGSNETVLGLPYIYPSNGSGSFVLGLTVRFAQPVFATATMPLYYALYDTQNPFMNNEFDIADSMDLPGGTEATFLYKLSAGWRNGSHYTYRPLGAALAITPLDYPATEPYTYTVTGFQAVPEPATWALMIVGFGAIGAAMRRRPAARHDSIERKLEQS